MGCCADRIDWHAWAVSGFSLFLSGLALFVLRTGLPLCGFRLVVASLGLLAFSFRLFVSCVSKCHERSVRTLLMGIHDCGRFRSQLLNARTQAKEGGPEFWRSQLGLRGRVRGMNREYIGRQVRDLMCEPQH